MGSDVGQIESIIGVQWGQKNPNPRVHRSSGKRGLPVDPRVGIFLEPLNTNDQFFFSYTVTVRYSTVYLSVTSLRSMFTFNDARCTISNQLETANKQCIKQ